MGETYTAAEVERMLRECRDRAFLKGKSAGRRETLDHLKRAAESRPRDPMGAVLKALKNLPR
jgi:hypothetical protein